jgi:hypothetical protein
MLPTHGNVDTWIGFAELAKGSVPCNKLKQIINRNFHAKRFDAQAHD